MFPPFVHDDIPGVVLRDQPQTLDGQPFDSFGDSCSQHTTFPQIWALGLNSQKSQQTGSIFQPGNE